MVMPSDYRSQPDLITFALTFMAFVFIDSWVGIVLLFLVMFQYLFRLTPIWSELIRPRVLEHIHVSLETVPGPLLVDPENNNTHYPPLRIESTPSEQTEQWLQDLGK
jgi:hypothetical protein